VLNGSTGDGKIMLPLGEGRYVERSLPANNGGDIDGTDWAAGEVRRPNSLPLRSRLPVEDSIGAESTLCWLADDSGLDNPFRTATRSDSGITADSSS
jgi:hypothetical protein